METLKVKTAYFFLALLICFAVKAYSQNNEEEIILVKPAEDTVTLDSFYGALSDEGEWIKVDKDVIDPDGDINTVYIDEDINVEYIWRPRYNAIIDNWNPYTNGYWVWCNYGWTWVSYYDWGWGPYHYGRWWYSMQWGWVWSPGCTWAPAWVNWCHTSGHVGWHPISPRTPWHWNNGIVVTQPVTPKQRSITNKWTFVSKSDFTKTINTKNFIDIKANKQILSEATINAKGNKVYNAGPKVNDLEKNTGQKITQKKVSFSDEHGNKRIDNGRVPKVKTPENATRTSVNTNRTSVTKTGNPEKSTKTQVNKNTHGQKYNNPGNTNKKGSYNPGNTNRQGSDRQKNSDSYRQSSPNNHNSNSNRGSNRNTESRGNNNSGTKTSPGENKGSNNRRN